MYELGTMRFYWWKENSKIIVQNAAMGMMGQKHEHTPKDFKRWCKDIPKEALVYIGKD